MYPVYNVVLKKKARWRRWRQADLLWIWGQLIYRTGSRTARAVPTDNLVWGRRKNHPKKANKTPLLCWVWWCMPLFPALRRQRQEDSFDFLVNLVYIMSSRTSQEYTLCFKKERTDGMWSYVNSEFIYIWGCICLFACFNAKVCLCLHQSAGIKGMHHHSWLCLHFWENMKEKVPL